MIIEEKLRKFLKVPLANAFVAEALFRYSRETIDNKEKVISDNEGVPFFNSQLWINCAEEWQKLEKL